jgi:hypothetical protein
MKKSLGKATELVLGLKTIFYSPSYTARREFISHKEAQKSSTNALTTALKATFGVRAGRGVNSDRKLQLEL